MLNVDAGVCNMASASGIPKAAHASALNERIPLAGQVCVYSLARGIGGVVPVSIRFEAIIGWSVFL